MEIGIVGSGRMARAMGGYLADRGYPVRGLWSRDPHRAQLAADAVGVPRADSLAALAARSQLLVLAVSDDAIRPLAEELARQASLSGKWVGHLSGSRSVGALQAAADAGAQVFSLHPLLTVAEGETGRRELARAHFVLEAAPDTQEALGRWLTAAGNRLSWVEPSRKGLYHLGACLASNYVMVLYQLAEEALTEAGLSREDAAEALLPLMGATLGNYRELGPLQGLTGPVVRGDAETVRSHLDSLEGARWQGRRPLVQALGREALLMARQAGALSAEQAEALEQILREDNR